MRNSIHAAAILFLVVHGTAPAMPENPRIVPDLDATCSCGSADPQVFIRNLSCLMHFRYLC